MSYWDDVKSDVLGEDWEKWICPLKGPIGSDLCYVDRDSEECRKCEEAYIKEMTFREGKNGTR